MGARRTDNWVGLKVRLLTLLIILIGFGLWGGGLFPFSRHLASASANRPVVAATSPDLRTELQAALLQAHPLNPPDQSIPISPTNSLVYVEQQRITNPDATSGDGFGWSVALNAAGDVALVGALSKNNNQGVVYILVRNGTGATAWTLQQELLAPAGSKGYFGGSLALNAAGDIALIGVPGIATPYDGLAYIFVRITNNPASWQLQQTLSAPGYPSSYFGNSVALNAAGDTALLSNPHTNTAYIFVRSGNGANPWIFQQALVVPGALKTALGRSVALNAAGDTALMLGETESYIFIRTGNNSNPWTLQQSLPDDTGGAYNQTASAALNASGSIAVISGANNTRTVGSAKNLASVFVRNGSGPSSWVLQQTLTVPYDYSLDFSTYGSAVALDSTGNKIIVSAINRYDPGNASAPEPYRGMVYVFARPDGVVPG